MANEYINKVVANNNTLIDLTSDTAEAADVLEGRTLHLASGAPAVGTYRPSDEIEARLEATVGHSSKNLLKIEADSQTINGVTFTVDKTAGTITANGQVEGSSTAQFDFIPRQSIDSRINGLILTEPTSATTPNYGLRTSIAYYNASNQFISEQTINSGKPNPIVVSLPSGTASYKVYVRVARSAGTLNNLVIKPMLREASISDDTFEPYVTPTDEKKQDKPVVLWEAALNSTGVSEVAISSLADDISNYSYLKVVVTNELGTTITDQTAIQTDVEYNPSYIGQDVAKSTGGMLGWHEENGSLVFDRLFIWVFSYGTNISVIGLRDHNDSSNPPDTVPGLFIRRIIGIPK